MARSRDVLASTAGGTGAYTESKGLRYREHQPHVFGEERRAQSRSRDDLYFRRSFFRVNYMLTLLIRGKQDAMLVPIPQYPLYSAGLALYVWSQFRII